MNYQFFEQFVYAIIKQYEGITLEDIVILLVDIRNIIKEETLLLILNTMAAKKLILFQKNEEGFTELFINCYEESLLNSVF